MFRQKGNCSTENKNQCTKFKDKSDTDSSILVRRIHSTCSNKQFLNGTLWKTSEDYLRTKTKQGMQLRNIATFVLSSFLRTDTGKGWNHNCKK